MTSLSGLIKGILLAILTTMMLLLVALALVSLARLDNGRDDTIGTVPGVPVEPLASIPLGPTGTEGSVSCFRPEGDGASFVVQLQSPDGVVGPYLIGVDLVGPDGVRSARTVRFPSVEPGVATQGLVDESTDPAAHSGCVITAIEIDRRIILTGQ